MKDTKYKVGETVVISDLGFPVIITETQAKGSNEIYWFVNEFGQEKLFYLHDINEELTLHNNLNNLIPDLLSLHGYMTERETKIMRMKYIKIIKDSTPFTL